MKLLPKIRESLDCVDCGEGGEWVARYHKNIREYEFRFCTYYSGPYDHSLMVPAAYVQTAGKLGPAILSNLVHTIANIVVKE